MSAKPKDDPIVDLVCVHAAASGPATWSNVQEQMGHHGVRVHPVTLLGHGTPRRQRGITAGQVVDDLLDQVEQLSIERFALAGHSFGAYVCVSAAPTFRSRLQLLVLEEVSAPPQVAGDQTASRVSGPLIAVAGAASRRTSLRQMRTIVKLIDSPTPDWWNTIAQVYCPTLVIAGGSRSHLDQRRLAEVADAFPAGSMTTISVGHHVHRKAPQDWVAAVMADRSAG